MRIPSDRGILHGFAQPQRRGRVQLVRGERAQPGSQEQDRVLEASSPQDADHDVGAFVPREPHDGQRPAEALIDDAPRPGLPPIPA